MPGQILRCAFGSSEWGFLQRKSGARPSCWPPDWQLIEVAKLPVSQVQFCRVAVGGAASRAEIIVLMAYFPALSSHTCDAITTALRDVMPAAHVASIVEDAPARALVIGPASEECAFAVAVAKYRGSFDEVARMEIVIDGRSFDVQLELGDHEHIGRVA
jgi:hypothetical protein